MKISQKQIEKMAKKMGMQMQEIDAEEVIIRTSDKEIVISNPSVSRVNMMGQDTFQISGEVSERSKEKFSQEDVDVVKEKTGASEDEIRRALEETGDLAEAIIKLSEKA